MPGRSVLLMLLYEASIEKRFDGFAIHILSDEYEFLHAIAILFVPIAFYLWILLLELCQFVGGHSGIPLTGLAERYLLASLLKHVAHIGLGVEVAHALAANHALGEESRYKLIELYHAEWLAALVYEGADAILQGFALFFIFESVAVVVVMMVVVAVGFVLIMVVVMVMIVVMMIMVVLFFVRSFYFSHPAGGCGYGLKVEAVTVDEFF